MRKILLLFLTLTCTTAWAQLLQHNRQGLVRVTLPSGARHDIGTTPLISFRVNGQVMAGGAQTDKRMEATYVYPPQASALPYKVTFTLKNVTATDTLTVDNVVPFGESPNHVYITGLGDHRLSRSVIYRPGHGPIGVILPDNSWELGFGILPLPNNNSVAGLARRKSWDKAQRRRFETQLFPGGQVTYELWFEPFAGNWQEGLRLIFQKHFLFDLEQFDNTLFEREDLAWIRSVYAINLMMAWDKDFYDRQAGAYTLPRFLEKAEAIIGGWDVVGYWPTWPALGLDRRSQWDMFRSLPGGTSGLKQMSAMAHKSGTKLFLCYNPWDESTSATSFAEQMEGMTAMLRATDADGVVLDTRGSSSAEIQAAGDDAQPGVVMYSEGMAVPKDMPGIISGRVHNALVYPPLLNLNKFIKPDFAIFRVAELAYEPILREYNLSLFNGHGVEINQFQPGRPEWVDEQYKYLGRVLRVLRNHSSVFNYGTYTPLVPALKDSVYVNEWRGEDKTVYTIYNAQPEGFSGPLFELDLTDGRHAVDVWNHRPVTSESGRAVVHLDAFEAKCLGTNNEGSVGAIAVFPTLLHVSRHHNDLVINSPAGNLKIWRGAPAYDKEPLELEGGHQSVSIVEALEMGEGHIVIQYFVDDDLRDEAIVELKPSGPLLVSKLARTAPATSVGPNEVRIPGGNFRYAVDHREDEFLPYPRPAAADTTVAGFVMDRYPVTNGQFYNFLQATGYAPADTSRFLRHWQGGRPPAGQEEFPVVYVALEDARAYAAWRSARLPTELEWQYAAQSGDASNNWPWGSEMDSTRTSRGDGVAYAVGQFASGKNTMGLEDLVGNVWQLTNDVYFNGTSAFIILKGGSYFNPTSSWWYVKGGPRPLPWRQMLLRVSPGFERSATVGFRTVRDE